MRVESEAVEEKEEGKKSLRAKVIKVCAIVMAVVVSLVFLYSLAISIWLLGDWGVGYQDIQGYKIMEDISNEDITVYTRNRNGWSEREMWDGERAEGGCAYEEFDSLAEIGQEYFIKYKEKAGFRRTIEEVITVVDLEDLPKGMYKLEVKGKRFIPFIDFSPIEEGYYYNKGID